nr:hypothetical protein [uncultured Mediterranean phage uvMED]
MLNKLTQTKQGERMKTKKIEAGVYQITTNKNTYRVEQNIELFDKGWEIFSNNGKEDIASTLYEAKELIHIIEERA